MKQLRVILISVLVLLIIGWVYIVYFTDLTSDSFDLKTPQQELAMLSVANDYPDAYTFVENYFMAIENGNYDLLLSEYWNAEVASEIIQACSNPLSDDAGNSAEDLWKICAYFDDINVEIIDINEVEDGYEVRLQFFDNQGEIIGRETHPEWVSGHRMMINQVDGELKTSDWRFL